MKEGQEKKIYSCQTYRIYVRLYIAIPLHIREEVKWGMHLDERRLPRHKMIDMERHANLG